MEWIVGVKYVQLPHLALPYYHLRNSATCCTNRTKSHNWLKAMTYRYQSLKQQSTIII